MMRADRSGGMGRKGAVMEVATVTDSWRLDEGDPLHSHLAQIVLPRAGKAVKHPDFEVGRLSNNGEVYAYQERESRSLFVCKFFGSRWYLSEQERKDGLNYEFKNLSTVRDMGFCKFPYRVVRPLSMDERLNCLLVEDFVRGRDLDWYITKAAYEGQREGLFRRLTELAHFLAEVHNRTAHTARVNFANTATYFRHVSESLAGDGLIDSGAAGNLRRLCSDWERNAAMWEDVPVLVHGDVTPTNFIFHPHDGVTAIDLERMHSADRVYDIGMLAAELKHHFGWRVFQADAAEPFIDRFLCAYCEDFPEPESVFNAVTYRNRFYMALGELRIARNKWLPREHRKWLTDEARRCLQS
jgi:aminoglycoside phosphotransferase (APT) family kinase protein